MITIRSINLKVYFFSNGAISTMYNTSTRNNNKIMRKPNILRRKTKQVPTDNVNVVKKSQQSLIKSIDSREENVNAVKSLPKTLPRARNPPQRIVLDSYLSSKNRIIKNDEEAIINNFLTTENSYILLDSSNQTYYIKTDDSVQNLFSIQYNNGVHAAEDVIAQVEVENPPQINQDEQTDDSDLTNFLNDGENVNIYEEIHQDLSENKTEISEKSSYDECTKCEIVDPNYCQRVVAEALETVGITNDNLFFIQASNGSKSWVCPNDGCDVTFKTQYLLKNHILTHFDLRPFKCSYDGCSKAFRFMSKLRTHYQTHFTVKRKSLLKTSVENNVNLKRKISCPVKSCKSLFDDRPELSTHLSDSHSTDEAIHKCTICDKRFWYVSGLMAHIRAHTPGKLTCLWPGCGLKFYPPSRLKYHMRLHTGDKPYKCTFPMCTWAFASASKLKRHSLAHSASRERRHVCEICGRGFTRAQHLREHLPRHTPHRPHSFACDYPGCKDKFSNKSSVYTHKKREHTAEGKLKSIKTKKGQRGKNSLKTVETQIAESEKLDSGSARTHVPWDTKDQISTMKTTIEDILPQTINCDENQGNPLVCGGLELEGDNVGVVGALTLEVESVVGSALPELGPDILGNSVDHINSLLQEELTDGMLYTTEDEVALRVLLLSGDQAS